MGSVGEIIVLVVLAVFGVLWLLHYFYFLIWPRMLADRPGADDEQIIRSLERIAATPSLLGASYKLVVHLILSKRYLVSARYQEGADKCRANLQILKSLGSQSSTMSLQADIHDTLADCLDGLGQTAEAAEQRRLAEEAVAEGPADTLAFLTDGKLLEHENRHQEAYETYQLALEMTPPSQNGVRLECLLHLVLSAYNSGHPAECLKWAEEAISSGASGSQLVSVHKMAGIVCGNLSRLDESEKHFQRACEAAASIKSASERGDSLGLLADCLRKRGKLPQAQAAAIEAGQLDPKSLRMSYAVQTGTLIAWGRFAEALAVFDQFRNTPPLAVREFEVRTQAVIQMERALAESDCGRHDDAWEHIQQALAVFRNDAKLGLRCQSSCCRILAAQDQTDSSRQLVDGIETRLEDFEQDPSVCRGVLYDLGVAAFHRGDYEEGVTRWTRYLDLQPDPVNCPTAYYYRGECHQALGRSFEARNDFRAASDLNLDTHHTRLARQRLAELKVTGG